MTIKTTLKVVIPHIKRCLAKRLVPMIHGSPAIGKSDVIKQIAREAGLWIIDVRLSTYDPADMNGLPFKVEVRPGVWKSSYLPFDTFPISSDTIPDGYKGWLIFMDELPSAAPAVQAAAFKFILDRQVGQHELHKMAFVVAAGNTEDDGAIVNPLPTPLQSRMINFMVKPDFKSWMHWALQNQLDYRIAAFLNFKPEMFYKFNPNHDDLTFASPRTWMFTSKLVLGEVIDSDSLPLVAGCVSEGVAREFVSFVKIFDKTPKMDDIIRNPTTALLPKDNPSILYALSGALGNHADTKNIAALTQYIERMPMEFQVLTFKQIFTRHTHLQNEKCVDNWIEKHSDEIWE